MYEVTERKECCKKYTSGKGLVWIGRKSGEKRRHRAKESSRLPRTYRREYPEGKERCREVGALQI